MSRPAASADADFADRVIESLEHRGVPASRLIVEVTETALLTDPARAAVVLSTLDAHGVRVSIDDFGCGQTSLGYLSSLPIHELKIDKSFVSDMLEDRKHACDRALDRRPRSQPRRFVSWLRASRPRSFWTSYG